MNFRSSGAVICLLATAAAGCGIASATTAEHTQAPRAVNASTSASTIARDGCQRPANDVLTLASNGRTYCVRVGERFDVYLRGTVAQPWLVPLATSDVIKPVPKGELSLAAGLTGGSFAGVRPGPAVITSVRLPCPDAIVKPEAEPAGRVPNPYRLWACAPDRRFTVTVIVLR